MLSKSESNKSVFSTGAVTSRVPSTQATREPSPSNRGATSNLVSVLGFDRGQSPSKQKRTTTIKTTHVRTIAPGLRCDFVLPSAGDADL